MERIRQLAESTLANIAAPNLIHECGVGWRESSYGRIHAALAQIMIWADGPRAPSLTPAQQAFYDGAMEYGLRLDTPSIEYRAEWIREQREILRGLYRAVLAEKEGGEK